MGKRIATACQVWVCVRRAHLLERLLQLVQLVKAQGLQVDPALAIGHAFAVRAAARSAATKRGKERPPCKRLLLLLLLPLLPLTPSLGPTQATGTSPLLSLGCRPAVRTLGLLLDAGEDIEDRPQDGKLRKARSRCRLVGGQQHASPQREQHA